jgi:hypothetical protein
MKKNLFEEEHTKKNGWNQLKRNYFDISIGWKIDVKYFINKKLITLIFKIETEHEKIINDAGKIKHTSFDHYYK